MTSSNPERPQVPDSISSDALGRLLGPRGSQPVSPALRLDLNFGPEASPLDLSVAFEQLMLANGNHGCTLAQLLTASNHMVSLILDAMLAREHEMASQKAFDLLKDITEIRLCCEILDRISSRVLAGSFLHRNLGSSPSDGNWNLEALLPLLSQPIPVEDVISRTLLETLGLDADAYYAHQSKS
jgi:hypothetical protein